MSTDCGTSWTTVWDRTGSGLTTAAPVGNGRFYPNVSDWDDNTVDLSAYEGETIYIAWVLKQNDTDGWFVDNFILSNKTMVCADEVLEGNRGLKTFK